MAASPQPPGGLPKGVGSPQTGGAPSPVASPPGAGGKAAGPSNGAADRWTPSRSGSGGLSQITSMLRDDSQSAFNLPSWLTSTSAADPPPSMLSEDASERASQLAQHAYYQEQQQQAAQASSSQAASGYVPAADSSWIVGGAAAANELLDPIPRAYTPSYQSGYSSDVWEQSSSISGLGELNIDDMDSQMDGADDPAAQLQPGAAGAGMLAYDPSQQDTYDNPMSNQALLSSDVFGGAASAFGAGASAAPPMSGAAAAAAGQSAAWADLGIDSAMQSPKGEADATAANGAGSYAILAGMSSGGQAQQQQQRPEREVPDREATLLAAPRATAPPAAVKSGQQSETSSQHSSVYSESVPPGNLQLGAGNQLSAAGAPGPMRASAPPAQQTPQQQQPGKGGQQQSAAPNAPDLEAQRFLFAAALQHARQLVPPAKLDGTLLERRSKSINPDDAAAKPLPPNFAEQLAAAESSNPGFVPQMMANLAQSLQRELSSTPGASGLFGGSLETPSAAVPSFDKPQREDSYDKLKAFLGLDKDQTPSNWTPAWAKPGPQREDSYDKLKAFLGLDKDDMSAGGAANLDSAKGTGGGLELPGGPPGRKRSKSDIGPRTPSGTSAVNFWGAPGSGKTGMTPTPGIFMGSSGAGGAAQNDANAIAQQQAAAAFALWAAQNKVAGAGAPADAAAAAAAAALYGQAVSQQHVQQQQPPQQQQQPPQQQQQPAQPQLPAQFGTQPLSQDLLVMAFGQDSGTRSTMDPSLLQQQDEQAFAAQQQQQQQQQLGMWPTTPGSRAGSNSPMALSSSAGPMRPRSAGRGASAGQSATPYGGHRIYSAGTIGSAANMLPTAAAPPPTAWRFPNLPVAMAGYPQQSMGAGAWAGHKASQSEDLSGNAGSGLVPLITAPNGHLAPPSSAGSAGSQRSHPYKQGRRRRPSNASSRSASSTGSSPYRGGLGMSDGSNPDLRLESPVNATVTTAKTQAASASRRKADAHFVCPFPGCGSTFTRALNLKGHIRSHNDEKPFKCGYPGCNRAFARAHDQKRHHKLHLNIRPHMCEHCGKTFARLDALNRHHKHDSKACGVQAAAAEAARASAGEASGSGKGADADTDAASADHDEDQAPQPPAKDDVPARKPSRSGSGSKFKGMVL